MASTVTPGPNETRSKIIWYTCGQMVNSAILGPELDESATAQIRNYIPNLVPTTYEASNAYLQEELKKPQGERNLLREMCMMIPLNLPKDRKVYFKSDAIKQLLPLVDGAAFVYPTTDLPPNTFGTWDKLGYLDNERLVWDPQTQEPQQGMVLLAYFTKVGLDDPGNFKAERIQLDIKSPFN